MEKSFTIIGELIRSNTEIARFQQDNIQDLLTKDYPYEDSKRLIDVLEQINKEIIKILEGLKTNFSTLEKQREGGTPPDTIQYERLSNKLLIYSKLIWELNTILHYVEQSVRENVSQSTVFLINHLAREYEKTSSFFLTATTEHNYLYRDIKNEVRELIQDSIPNTVEIIARLRENFSRISFPTIYRDNIVTNVLLAHEIGHFIVELNKLNKAFPKITMKIPTIYAKEVTMDELTYTYEKWIVELWSDMIGFNLSGPVFFFALAEEMLSMFGPTAAGKRHPPPNYRLKLLLEEVESRKFIEAVKDDEERKRIKELVENIKNYIPDVKPVKPLHKLALKYVDSIKDQIKKTANNTTKKVQYAPKSFGKDIPKLLQKLEDIIPPCEIEDGKPADIISILNAGMIYKMTWQNKAGKKKLSRKTIDETERTINEIVLYSIELSVLQKEMLQNMKRKKK